jgi:hypothetical protein
LPAGAAGSHVDERSAGVLDAVEQEEIVLRASAGDRKHVADRRVGSADPARPLIGVIDRAWIESDELIIAAAVQRKLLHLPLIDKPGGLLRRDIDGRRSGIYHHTLCNGADGEGDVNLVALTHGEHDARKLLATESCASDRDVVAADSERRGRVPAIAASDQRTFRAGLRVVDDYPGSADGRAGAIRDDTADGTTDHLGVDTHGCNKSQSRETEGTKQRRHSKSPERCSREIARLAINEDRHNLLTSGKTAKENPRLSAWAFAVSVVLCLQ